MDNSIATPHWEACETCRHHKDNGCGMPWLELEALGDFIVCHDYLAQPNIKSCAPENPHTA